MLVLVNRPDEFIFFLECIKSVHRRFIPEIVGIDSVHFLYLPDPFFRVFCVPRAGYKFYTRTLSCLKGCLHLLHAEVLGQRDIEPGSSHLCIILPCCRLEFFSADSPEAHYRIFLFPTPLVFLQITYHRFRRFFLHYAKLEHLTLRGETYILFPDNGSFILGNHETMSILA